QQRLSPGERLADTGQDRHALGRGRQVAPHAQDRVGPEPPVPAAPAGEIPAGEPHRPDRRQQVPRVPPLRLGRPAARAGAGRPFFSSAASARAWTAAAKVPRRSCRPADKATCSQAAKTVPSGAAVATWRIWVKKAMACSNASRSASVAYSIVRVGIPTSQVRGKSPRQPTSPPGPKARVTPWAVPWRRPAASATLARAATPRATGGRLM